MIYIFLSSAGMGHVWVETVHVLGKFWAGKMFLPWGQLSWASGLCCFFILVSSLWFCLTQELTRGSCELFACPYTFVIATVSIVIARGLPVSSSSRTSWFLVRSRKDLGTWYLKIVSSIAKISYYWEINCAGQGTSYLNGLL